MCRRAGRNDSRRRARGTERECIKRQGSSRLYEQHGEQKQLTAKTGTGSCPVHLQGRGHVVI